MDSPAAKTFDASRCPLCGRPNDCQHCTMAAYKGPCWCFHVKIPDELLAQVPADLRNQACICRACVMKFHRTRNAAAAPAQILPGDFYFDGGRMVFTAAHLRRRGFCCGNHCRHCPYPEPEPAFLTGGKTGS